MRNVYKVYIVMNLDIIFFFLEKVFGVYFFLLCFIFNNMLFNYLNIFILELLFLNLIMKLIFIIFVLF